MRQEKELLVELKEEEMLEIDGGGWREAGGAFFGGIAVGATPFACAIGGSAVGAATFSFGCFLLDRACDR